LLPVPDNLLAAVALMLVIEGLLPCLLLGAIPSAASSN